MRNRQIKLVADHDETTDMRTEKAQELHAREMRLARKVMDVLQAQYPNHPWMVKVDGKGVNKAVLVKLPAIMRPQDHYVLPIPTLLAGSINDFARLVTNAGGRILEEFNIPRSGFACDPFMAARQAHLQAPKQRLLST